LRIVPSTNVKVSFPEITLPHPHLSKTLLLRENSKVILGCIAAFPLCYFLGMNQTISLCSSIHNNDLMALYGI